MAVLRMVPPSLGDTMFTLFGRKSTGAQLIMLERGGKQRGGVKTASSPIHHPGNSGELVAVGG